MPMDPEVWADRDAGLRRLEDALRSFDWSTADDLAAILSERLAADPSGWPDAPARRALQLLRRKRRFRAMVPLAEALLRAGLGGHQVRRQYAQALIDQGTYHGAELVLRSILADPSTPDAERAEARGLIGRIYKQLYVNARAPGSPLAAEHLRTAIQFYWQVYSSDPTEHTWHGINVVALLRRAGRDGVEPGVDTQADEVARAILGTLAAREEQSPTGELEAWDLSTAMEAHLSLGEWDRALGRAEAYAACAGADAFELGSTLRQLEEVWQLGDDEEPGASLLPVLRAELLTRQGGTLHLAAQSVARGLEKVFGADRAQSLQWYQTGLERARSIARIEWNGKGVGTAWLVSSTEFFPAQPPRTLLITNAHVVAPDELERSSTALLPEDAVVHFQIQGARFAAGMVVFHSPPDRLDATFLELPETPRDVAPLPVDFRKIRMSQPPERLYIIGHPGGRDLEFSLQDNHLLAADDRVLHYRTPTEPGSSGSPVFGANNWKVVALHHSGQAGMRRLGGAEGLYEANEGIGMAAIRAATMLGG